MRREHDPGTPGAESGPHTAGDLDAARRAARRRAVQIVSLLGLVVILVAFVIENSQRVRIHFVFFSRDVRPIWLMLTCAILGGVVGFLLGRPGKQLGRRGKHEGKDPSKKSPELS